MKDVRKFSTRDTLVGSICLDISVVSEEIGEAEEEEEDIVV